MKKVYELAKEIGITPLELVEVLKHHKIPVKSHMSEISPDQEDELHFKIKQEIEQREALEKVQAKSKADHLIASAPAKKMQLFQKKPPVEKPTKKDKVALTCVKCKSDKIADVGGKVSDMFHLSLKEFEYEGYVLQGINIGGGDYLRFSYCLECGQMAGKFPVSLGKEATADYDDDESDD